MDKMIVCNKENGCMSQLFGRNCWVADSMLKLIISAVEEKGVGEEAIALAEYIEKYCNELRQMNKEYWDDTVFTEARAL